MGVVSNRVDVRAASARAERALLAGAEPLSALFLPPDRWPGALLDEAWRAVVLNAAHDSVCACSIDDVCGAVLTRYREAADIGEGLAARAATHLAARVDHDGPLVVNPTARGRAGRGGGAGHGGAGGDPLLRAWPGTSTLHSGPPEIVVPAAQEVDWIPTVSASAVEDEDGTVLVANERRGTAQLGVAEVRSALDALRTGHTGRLRLTVRQPEQVTVLAHVAGVPGFGWRCWSPGDGRRGPGDGHRAGRGCGRRHRPGPGQRRGDRGRRPADGTFALDGHGGLGRLVDGGDCGDTYNWCPPTTDTVVDAPESVDVRVLERGLLRARVLVTIRYRWPAGREASTAVAPPPSTTRCARCSSCGPASGPCASRCASTTPAATTGCGPTSLPSPTTVTRAECAPGPSREP